MRTDSWWRISLKPSPRRSALLPTLLIALAVLAPLRAQPENEPPDPLLIPPGMIFIEDYQLPPGPADEIVEYRLVPQRKRTPLPAAPAPAVTPSPAPQPEPRPETTTEPRPEPVAQTPAEPQKAPPADFSGEADLLAPEDDQFSLYLEGSGWLFTEALSDRGEKGGIEYRGRNRSSGGIRFSFASRGRGRYRLIFVRSGASGSAGGTTSYLVEVLREDEFLTRVSGQPAEMDPEEALPEGAEGAEAEEAGTRLFSLAQIEELLIEGRYGEALGALNRDSFTETLGREDAGKLWVLRIAAEILSGRGPDQSAVAEPYDPARSREFIEQILGLGARLGGQDELNLLHGAYRIFESRAYGDRLLYRLALRYETPGPVRDIEAAVRFYKLLVREYPLSPFWEAAEERRNYLERHFLLIR